MMRNILDRDAPSGRLLANQYEWSDAEVRAFLGRPQPSLEPNIVGLVVVLSMGVAAANIVWLLLSQIKG